MLLGTMLGQRGSPERFKTHVHGLEAAGIDQFWTGEAYGSDGVTTLGFLAAVTKRAFIGSSILPLYSRTPGLLAMTGLGLHSLSGGRAMLGLGASGPQVVEGLHGVPFDAPVGRTREIIEICRQAWRGERIEHQGQRYQLPLSASEGTGMGKALALQSADLPASIPIYVAALGTANVEMVAEVADGWLPLHFWPEKAASVYGSPLAAGAARRAPGLGPLQVVAGGPLCITEDFAGLRAKSRATLAFYFGGMGSLGKNFYNDLLRRYGHETEAAAIQDAWLRGNRKEAMGLVPQELVDAVSLVGPASWVRERIEAHREAGVTCLTVDPVGPDKLGDVERVRAWLG